MRGDIKRILGITFVLSSLLTSALAAQPSPSNNIVNYNYNKADATLGFELLIKGQAGMVQDFDNLLSKFSGQLSGANNATFLAIFEDLIRRQANLHQNFASILGNETHWNFTDPKDQVRLLDGYGELIENETVIYGHFYVLLNCTWCNKDFIDSNTECHNPAELAQIEFLNSFYDLLLRQNDLLKSFCNLTNNLSLGVAPEDRKRFLRVFQILLKWHSAKIEELSKITQNPCTKWTKISR